jgi:hypothetical protein
MLLPSKQRNRQRCLNISWPLSSTTYVSIAAITAAAAAAATAAMTTLLLAVLLLSTYTLMHAYNALHSHCLHYNISNTILPYTAQLHCLLLLMRCAITFAILLHYDATLLCTTMHYYTIILTNSIKGLLDQHLQLQAETGCAKTPVPARDLVGLFVAVHDDPFELLEKSFKLVQKRLSGQAMGGALGGLIRDAEHALYKMKKHEVCYAQYHTIHMRTYCVKLDTMQFMCTSFVRLAELLLTLAAQVQHHHCMIVESVRSAMHACSEQGIHDCRCRHASTASTVALIYA